MGAITENWSMEKCQNRCSSLALCSVWCHICVSWVFCLPMQSNTIGTDQERELRLLDLVCVWFRCCILDEV